MSYMLSVLLLLQNIKAILYIPANGNSSTFTIYNKNVDDQTSPFSPGYWNTAFISAAVPLRILAANSV